MIENAETIKVYTPREGDVLLVQPKGAGYRLSRETAESIQAKLQETVPASVKVLVVPESLDFSVVREEDVTQ